MGLQISTFQTLAFELQNVSRYKMFLLSINFDHNHSCLRLYSDKRMYNQYYNITFVFCTYNIKA